MPGIPTAKFDVSNLDQWGRLVKSWATGLNYVDTDYADQPPRTFWVNKTWPGEDKRSPGPATVDNKDAKGKPLPWCLPEMQPFCVSMWHRAPADEWALTAKDTKVTATAVAMSSADFKAMIGQAGVDFSLPSQCENVVVVRGDDKTMVLKIPAKGELESVEDDLIKGVAYSLPSYYAALYGGPARVPASQAGLMWLHANRMGEYSLNNCS